MAKKYLVLLSVSVAALALAGGANAFWGGKNAAGQADIANEIASKFNLNSGDVQKVFESHRSQMQAEKQKRLDENLSQAVAAGKITQSQAELIKAKRAELQAQAPQTAEQRKAQLDSLKQWSDSNKIPLQYLGMPGGRGAGGKMGGFGGNGNPNCPMAK